VHFASFGNDFALHQIQITRPEGQLTGEAFWNAAIGELTFWDVKSSIDPVALSLWIDRSLAEAIETAGLPKGSTWNASGQLNWKKDELSGLQMQLSSAPLPLFNLPLFSHLRHPSPEDEPLLPIEAGVQLADGVLTVEPFAAANTAARLTGRAAWDLATQTFSGELHTDGSGVGKGHWKADAPWRDIIWKKASAP
jgi:hypothetical protein